MVNTRNAINKIIGNKRIITVDKISRNNAKNYSIHYDLNGPRYAVVEANSRDDALKKFFMSPITINGVPVQKKHIRSVRLSAPHEL